MVRRPSSPGAPDSRGERAEGRPGAGRRDRGAGSSRRWAAAARAGGRPASRSLRGRGALLGSRAGRAAVTVLTQFRSPFPLQLRSMTFPGACKNSLLRSLASWCSEPAPAPPRAWSGILERITQFPPSPPFSPPPCSRFSFQTFWPEGPPSSLAPSSSSHQLLLFSAILSPPFSFLPISLIFSTP